MRAKSSRFRSYALALLVIYVVFFCASCGVIGTDNNYSVSFSPSGVAFGKVPLGSVASQNAILSNPGNNPVTIATATLTGADFSLKGLVVPVTLNPGATVPFTVMFAPRSVGPQAGNISLTSTLSSQASVSLAISGTGASGASTPAAPQIGVSPASLSFGNILAGSTATQYLSISNTGGSTLTVSQVTVSGSSFNESGPVPPFTLAAGQSQTLAVNFAPASAGTYNGSLVVNSDAANSVGPVALSGTSTLAGTFLLTAAPTSVSFGSVVVGTSTTQTIALTNTGNSAVTVSSANLTGSGFTVSAPSFPVTIAAGQSQQASVRFAPSTSGTVTGSASFVSNATNSPAMVSLSGTGTISVTPAAIAVSPTPIAFGSILVNTTATQSVTVTNTGGSTLTVSQISVSGNGFNESGPVPPLTVAAGQSQNLSINFAPSATGSYTGSLSIASNATNRLAPIGISGTATALPVLTIGISPSSLSFGNIAVGSSSTLHATLTNTGNSSVTVFSATATGSGFTVTSPVFPVAIAAGGIQQISISFAPQASGSVTGSATFVSNASNSPTALSLIGTGTTAVQHSVDLSWNASTSTVVGYRVYRSLQSGGPYTVLNSTLDSSTTYTDATVQSGQTYYYVVSAVDGNGNESGFSNQATAVVP